MLLDAFRAEFYRLSKNRTTVFWSLVFVPMGLLLGGLGMGWFVISKTKQVTQALPSEIKASAADLGAPLLQLAGQIANPASLAFLLIGAATLFASDYRWETWRLISARNTRVNLLAGKLLTLLVMILLATIGLLIAGLLVLVGASLMEGSGLKLVLTASQWGDLGALCLLGMARLLQVLLLALLAAVVTRSLMAALFVPIVVSIAQNFAEKFLMFVQIMPTDWQAILMSPGLATSHLKTSIQGGLPPAILNEVVPLSLASLAVWITLPLVLSFILFQRQGLSKE